MRFRIRAGGPPGSRPGDRESCGLWPAGVTYLDGVVGASAIIRIIRAQARRQCRLTSVTPVQSEGNWRSGTSTVARDSFPQYCGLEVEWFAKSVVDFPACISHN